MPKRKAGDEVEPDNASHLSLVEDMLKRVNKNLEDDQKKKDDKESGIKKKRGKKARDGVRQPRFLAIASYEVEDEKTRKRRVQTAIKMLASKPMRGVSSKVEELIRRRQKK